MLSDFEEYCELLGYDPRAIAPVHDPLIENPMISEASLVGRSFDEIRNEALGCLKCDLCKTRKTVVFGDGTDRAEIMFIGEAPGYHEDQQGKPFVGPAGELLNKMIVAMGYSRETVYIANVIKCRPPDNRDPLPIEIETCRPYLDAQIKHIAPRAIVTLGTFATQVVLKTDFTISRLRGKKQSLAIDGKEIAVFPTFHPAFLLRNAERKKDVWADLQQVMAYLQA